MPLTSSREVLHSGATSQHATTPFKFRCVSRDGASDEAHRTTRSLTNVGSPRRATVLDAPRTRPCAAGVRRCPALILFVVLLLDTLYETSVSLSQRVDSPKARSAGTSVLTPVPPSPRKHPFLRGPVLFVQATQYALRPGFELNGYPDGACFYIRSFNDDAALSPERKAATSILVADAASSHAPAPAAAEVAAANADATYVVGATRTKLLVDTSTCPYYPLWGVMTGLLTNATTLSVPLSTRSAMVDAQAPIGTSPAAAVPAVEDDVVAPPSAATAAAAAAAAAAASTASDWATEPDATPTDGLPDDLRAGLMGTRKAVTYYYENLVTSVFFYLMQGGTITVTIGTNGQPWYANTLFAAYAKAYAVNMSQTGSDGAFSTDMYKIPADTDTHAAPASSHSGSSSSINGDGSSDVPVFPYPDVGLATTFFFWNQQRLHCLFNAPALMSQMVDRVNEQAASLQQLKKRQAAAAASLAAKRKEKQRRLFAQSAMPSQSLMELFPTEAAAAPSYPSCAAHMPSPDNLLPLPDIETLLGVQYMQLDSTFVVKIFTFDSWFEMTSQPVSQSWKTAPTGGSQSSSSSGSGSGSGTTRGAYETVTSGVYTTQYNSFMRSGTRADPLDLEADPVRVCAAPALYTIPVNPLLAQAASWTLGSADGWLQLNASVTHQYPPERVVAVLAQCSGVPTSFSITVSLVNPGTYVGSGQHFDTAIMYFLFLVFYALLLILFLVLIVPCSKRRHRSPVASPQDPQQPQQQREGLVDRDGNAERHGVGSPGEGSGSPGAVKQSSKRQPRGGGSSNSTKATSKAASAAAAAASGAGAAVSELRPPSQRSAAAQVDVSRPPGGERMALNGAAASDLDTSSFYSVRSSTSSVTRSSSSSSSSLDEEANPSGRRAPAAAAAGGASGVGRHRPRRAARDSSSSSLTSTSTSSSSESGPSSSYSSRSSDNSSDDDDDDMVRNSGTSQRHRQRHRRARQRQQRSKEGGTRGRRVKRRDRDAAAMRYAADLDDDDDDDNDSEDEDDSQDSPSRRAQSRLSGRRHTSHRRRRTPRLSRNGRDGHRHRDRDGRRGRSHRYPAAASAQVASALFSSARWRGALRRVLHVLTRRVRDPLRLWWKESHILIMFAPVQWIVMALIILKCLLCILYSAQYSLLAGMQLDVESIGAGLPLVGFMVEVASSTLLIPTEMLISMGYGLAFTSPVPTNHIVIVCIATPAMFVLYVLCATCDTTGINMSLTRNAATKGASLTRCSAFVYTRISSELLCRLHNVMRMMVLASYLSSTVVPADAAAVQRQRRLRLRQQRRAQQQQHEGGADDGTAASSSGARGASQLGEHGRGGSSSISGGASRRQHSRSASLHSASSSSSLSSSLNSSLNSRTASQLSTTGLLLPSNASRTPAGGVASGAMLRTVPITLPPPPRLDYPPVKLSAMEVYLRYHGMWKPFAVLLVWYIVFVTLSLTLYEPEDYYMIVAWREAQTVYLLGFILFYLRTAAPFYC